MNVPAGSLRIDSRLADPNSWWQTSDSRGGRLMMDPIYGVQLNPNIPPKFIMDEPELRGGIEYLRKNGPYLRLTNFYVDHGSAWNVRSATTPFEQVFKDFPFVAHEVVGDSKHGNQQLRAEMHTHTEYLSRLGRTGIDEFMRYISDLPGNRGQDTTFQARLFRAIVLHPNTTAVSIDLRSDGTPLEKQLVKVDKWLYANHPSSSGITLGKIGMSLNRDWIQLATLGIRLEEQFGPTIPRPIEAATISGASHGDKTRKLTHVLGVGATPIIWAPQNTRDNSHTLMTTIAATGIMTNQQARAVGI